VIFILDQRHVTFKLRVFHLQQTNLLELSGLLSGVQLTHGGTE